MLFSTSLTIHIAKRPSVSLACRRLRSSFSTLQRMPLVSSVTFTSAQVKHVTRPSILEDRPQMISHSGKLTNSTLHFQHQHDTIAVPTDNLLIHPSNLEVGEKYSYCVRAVASPHYMDAPFALSTERRLLTSSLNACDAHKILFEAGINGLVTTEPNAGSLPIEDVLVEWEMLTADYSSPLTCDGCSGETRTTDGGAFHIKIKADDDSLKGRNEDEIPVRIKYSKSTFTLDENDEELEIKHLFLCNNGQDECNAENGDIVYISHLNFDKSVHIYDDTSVPFSGRVIHSRTRSPEAPNGCQIVGAEVCLIHNTTVGILEELVCVETDRNGEFVAPVIIGGKFHAFSSFFMVKCTS